MSPVFDCTTEQGRADGIAAAVAAARAGQCVIMPTDTVYGIGTDAFSAAGVEAVLAAKGRGRDKPSAVLVADRAAVDGLATAVPSYARRLMDAFWPGGLTLVLRSQPTLAWDLGDTNGTVGLRQPDDQLTLEVLRQVGPMAVTSANRSGQSPVTTITDAGFAFGPAVEVYLDAGAREAGEPSTMLDCTKADPVVLRHGAVSADRLREVLGDVELVDPEASPVGVDLAKPAAPDEEQESVIPDPDRVEPLAAGTLDDADDADDAAAFERSATHDDSGVALEPDQPDPLPEDRGDNPEQR